MKDFKIEYVNGELVALDLNGMSLLDNVQGISFKHELGELPVINVTQGYKITAPEETPREVSGEVIHGDGGHEQQERRSKRQRHAKRR
ncbi:hypothetical protein AAHW98_17855 [Klebsiella variicola subsp. variicola]|uniref:hypothetical protein n=1 Tax=Klebsiella TaxID=570 RepID=UPI001CCEB356|nr:hypothetical protein [Klebsiella oxytoca]MBZ7632793.1 hypothetical protein [Klebsiella oxytoca]